MIDPHAALTLRAALIASSALRAIESVRSVLGPPNGEVTAFEDALSLLYSLYRPPAPPRPPVKRQRKPRPIKKPPRRAQERFDEEDLDAPSAWDPEPLYEASRCQAFLMEIIQRAAHDWVLYRQHHKLELKQLAEQAYIWLFEEEPGHPAWRTREKALFKVRDDDGQTVVEVGSRKLTSFLSICEACGLDPEAVRERAREMTVESIMKTGRHLERRRAKNSNDSMSIETHAVHEDIDIDSIEAEHQPYARESWETDYRSNDGYGIDSVW